MKILRKHHKSPPGKLSINALAEQTGFDRRTIRKRLVEAGMFPLDGHTRAEILDALKPKSGDKPGDSIKEKLVFEQWRKFRIRNDVDEGILIPRSYVAATVRRLGGKFTRLLDDKLENEYPAAIGGLDVPAAREYGKRLNDAIRAEVNSWASEWGNY